MLHVVDRVADPDRVVADHLEVHALGQPGAKRLHLRPHPFRHPHGVGARDLAEVQAERGGRRSGARASVGSSAPSSTCARSARVGSARRPLRHDRRGEVGRPAQRPATRTRASRPRSVRSRPELEVLAALGCSHLVEREPWAASRSRSIDHGCRGYSPPTSVTWRRRRRPSRSSRLMTSRRARSGRGERELVASAAARR